MEQKAPQSDVPTAGGEMLLEVRGLSKSYPGVQALAHACFDLRRGEVHALVGENGAGKSTLARIISGLSRPDGGTMLLRGKPYAPATKHQAERMGVRMVMQELNLIGTLSVAENILFDHLPHRLGLIDYNRLHADAKAVMAEVALDDIDPARRVDTLGVARQQMVEIASALSRRCDLLILDEPTAALSDAETSLLFEQIRRLKAGGAGIIYISHRLEEIQRLADRITVLRNGCLVATRAADGISLDEIVRLMVGREIKDLQRGGRREFTGVGLRVSGLCRGDLVRNVSLEVRRGEILGLAGLMGSGRTETLRAIFGADRPEKGSIFLHGSPRPARIRSPRDAVRQGIALLTEDRKQQGLLLPLSVRVNITLTNLLLVARLGWIRPAQECRTAGRFARALAVRCASDRQRVVELSGGNQQKVVIAKWLFRNCDVLLFDEPTRGIDVGAKFEIYRLLGDLASQGKAVLVVSSDLKELLAICDNIAVISAGRVVTVFERKDFSQDRILAAALSEYMGTTRKSGQSPPGIVQ